MKQNLISFRFVTITDSADLLSSRIYPGSHGFESGLYCMNSTQSLVLCFKNTIKLTVLISSSRYVLGDCSGHDAISTRALTMEFVVTHTKIVAHFVRYKRGSHGWCIFRGVHDDTARLRVIIAHRVNVRIAHRFTKKTIFNASVGN